MLNLSISMICSLNVCIIIGQTMYGFIISKKMDKCRQNIQSYMTSGSQGQKRSEINPMISRTTSQGFPQNIQSQTNGPNSQIIKNYPKGASKNEIELQSLNYALKKYDQGQIILKFSKQQGLLTVFFNEEHSKMRIDIKREDLKGKRIEIDPKKNMIIFSTKNLIVKRLDNKDGMKNGNQWISQRRQKQVLFHVVVKNKDQLKQFKQSSFCQGIIDAQSNIQISQFIKQADDPIEGQQDHLNPRFSQPTPERLAETQKLRRTIRQMKEQDKITVLMDIFKIKKQYDDPLGFNKKLKCPVSKCGKTYREIQLLKTHLKSKHPELTRHGIQLTEYDGSFEYNNKALDLALYLGKTQPLELKKIVKQMKTKTQAQ